MTLDQLSRTDLIKVLQQIKQYLDIKEEAIGNRRKIEYQIENKSQNFQQRKKSKKGIVFVLLRMFPILLFSFLFGIVGLIDFFNTSKNDDKAFNLVLAFGGFSIFIILILFLIFIRNRKNKKFEDEEYKLNKEIVGILPYISYYDDIAEKAQAECEKYYNYYNVHDYIKNNLDLINFIINEISCNSKVTLKMAIDEYTTLQHRKAMANEAKKQRTILEGIRQDNTEQHQKVIDGMDEIQKELHRQTQIESDFALEYFNRG